MNDPEGYVVCERCGAVVADAQVDVHATWHVNLNLARLAVTVANKRLETAESCIFALCELVDARDEMAQLDVLAIIDRLRLGIHEAMTMIEEGS